jgi:cytoskeletal protein RodZ
MPTHVRSLIMALIVLEALLALLLLVGIVWWTMFSGRKGGELHDPPTASDTDAEPEKPEASGAQLEDKNAS